MAGRVSGDGSAWRERQRTGQEVHQHGTATPGGPLPGNADTTEHTGVT